MDRERFCRDQHKLLLRQLFHIKQTASVQDYVNHFVDLIEQLSTYTPNPDTQSYTTRFINGLRDDIHSVVLVQRLADLDTACSLALLQEEAVKPTWHKEFKRSDGPSFIKPSFIRGPLPLPPPPRPAPPGAPANKQHPEERRPDHRRVSVDDKLQSLCSYHKARGLCMRCGEKWHQGHKCAPAIHLHALQEVWDLYQDLFVEGDNTEPDTPVHTEKMFMLLSAAVVSQQVHPRTLQFRRLDSGSVSQYSSRL